MTWSGRRQAIILFVMAVIVIAALTPIVAKVIPNPSCSDGKQNQNETGVDCGGPCQLACRGEALPLNILWARPFPVATGVISAVAYISNPNPNLEARAVSYTMKIYDEENLLVKSVSRKVDVPAKSTIAIFEGGLQSGEKNVKSAFFQFTDEPVWYKSSDSPYKVSFSAPILTSDPLPKIIATARNDSSVEIKNLPVVVIVYDNEGNAIASSQTIIQNLSKDEKKEIAFTWLMPFSASSTRLELVPKLPISSGNSSI